MKIPLTRIDLELLGEALTEFRKAMLAQKTSAVLDLPFDDIVAHIDSVQEKLKTLHTFISAAGELSDDVMKLKNLMGSFASKFTKKEG